MIALNKIQQKILLETLDKDALFYGNSELNEIISDSDIVNELCAYEIYDWINSMYWGETLGIRFSLKMLELTNDTKWTDILNDELDHQKRITEWILGKGLTISAPNLLMNQGIKLFNNLESIRSIEKMSDILQWSQLFLENLGVVINKWRHPYIKDRELKAVLYKILKDEPRHIATGKNILKELGIETPRGHEVMRS